MAKRTKIIVEDKFYVLIEKENFFNTTQEKPIIAVRANSPEDALEKMEKIIKEN
jgi:hypothetical protein